jgi:kynurenine formamidase
MHRKIGQLLEQIVPLTPHDIEDILQEQKATRQRFGDAALALGFVQPQHVWKAWIKQVESECVEVDLDAIGIDTQSLDHLPSGVARQFRVVPVRTSDNELVVACARSLDDVTKSQIQAHVRKHVHFVLTRSGQVEQALTQYYPPAAHLHAA